MIDVSIENANRLAALSKQMRLDGLEMAKASGQNGSHIGGSFSCIEILAVLYGAVMKYDVHNPLDEDRDRFIPSKNHCVLAHLPALAAVGFFPREELTEFQKDGGRLTGYPANPEIGLEYSGGSLGMAVSVGIGLALAVREKQKKSHIYVLVGDGELDEGSNWEGIMSVSQFQLDNYTLIIDRNHLSYDGYTEELMKLENLSAKFQAFNWCVSTCDGHNTYDLLRAYSESAVGKPHVIIADTVKGKGLSFAENRPEWHHHSITKEQYELGLQEILNT